MLSEKSSPQVNLVIPSIVNRLISVPELRAVAIKQLVELSVEHEFFAIFSLRENLSCLLKNINCGYSLEPPREPTIYVLTRNMKYPIFLSENFHFLVVNFSVYLNWHVFVMVLVILYLLLQETALICLVHFCCSVQTI